MIKHKKLLSFVLAAVMIVGMIPLTAIADDGQIDHIETCLADCTGESCECACHQAALADETPKALCDKCEATEDEDGNIIHAEDCKLYTKSVALTLNLDDETTTEGTTETTETTESITASVYEELMAYTDFDNFYTALLANVNDPEKLDDVMALTTEEIFNLIDKADALYAEIKEPSEENVQDKEDAMLTFSLLPNYREKCSDCGEYPCICEVEAECSCGAEEDELHKKECPAYYTALYERIMRAKTVNAFIDISSKMTEAEMYVFEQWVKENDLYEDYSVHVDALMKSATVGSTYPAVKSTLPKASGSVTSDALKMEKSASYNTTTGMYDIVLETYTTGVVEEGQVLPADTVLVLDVSGSMAFDYKLTRVGTPIYGDYFKHSTQNGCWWGWEGNGHMTNGKNPYVKLPNGEFKEAEYANTDNKRVEYFRVKGTGTLFYPVMLSESMENVPRQYDYPVYQLYSSTETERYTVSTGIPIFGAAFTYNSETWYGWLGNGESANGGPYVQLQDGSFIKATYERSDSGRVEIFKYTDEDTGLEVEFYPRLKENCNGITRAENLPVLQLYSSYNKTRMAALLNAVAEFLRLTAEKNEANAGNRVAMVQFSCANTAHSSQTTKVIMDFTEVTSANVDDLISFTYTITDGGASTHTEIGEGMKLAENLLNAVTRTSHKAVIAFTDGYPESCTTDSWVQADTAIECAKRLTDSYSASVYSVCIQDDAVVNAGGSLPANTGKENMINRFMHLLSNNYPSASSMSNTGSGSTTAGYYLVPGSEGDLTSIFTHIGEQIGSANVNLDDTTSVQDYITPYFYIPNDTQVRISVKDAVYTNGTLGWTDSEMDTSGITPTVNQQDKLVTVTGFDYNHNFVAVQGREEGKISAPGDFHGRKLVIQFSIQANPDFLGGEDVVTNEGTSGVYTSSGIVRSFEVPDVDVPLKEISPDPQAKNIYVSQAADLPALTNVGTYSTYQVDGINNAFVDITYTLNDGDGNKTSFTIPAGTKFEDVDDLSWSTTDGITSLNPCLTTDATYNVYIKVASSKTSGNCVDSNMDTKILVYKPVITFNDSAIDLGQTPVYASQNGGAVVWKHGEDDPANMMTATAPTLTYAYSPEAAAFTQDTPVMVTVTSGVQTSVPADMDITQYTTFYRDACVFDGCPNTELREVSATDANRVNFVVHLNTFDLKIDKVCNKFFSPADSFVYTVNGCNKNLTVVVNKNGEVIIKGLPIPSGDNNKYTIVEDLGWSNRYTAEPENYVVDNAYVKANKDNNGMVTVTFTNTLNNNKWLGDSSFAKNIFGTKDENDTCSKTIE